MKRQFSVVALVGAILLAVLPTSAASAATALTAEVGGWVQAGDTAPFSATLTGATGEDLIVTIELAEGTMTLDDSGLALTLQTGSVSFADVASVTFTGSAADVATALAERLSWTAPATPSQSYLRLTISVSSYYPGLVTDPASGHHYVQSAEALSWPNARDAAAALTYNGLTGYLVTITSGEENTFVTEQAGGATAYIAATSEIAYVNPLLAPEDQYASEVDARGRYHWGAGPEAGAQLTWARWFDGEPNNLAGERCLLTNWNGPTALWNDGACFSTYLYVVEFGGLGTDTGPAEFDNLDTAAPPLPEPELAATGVDPQFGLAAGLLALLLGVGMLALSSRRRGGLAQRTSSMPRSAAS